MVSHFDARETSLLHLAPAVRSAAMLPADERIRLLRQERWIGYQGAKDTLARLEELLDYPPRDRMPNLLIFGPTNNGKTKIIRRFLHIHAPVQQGEVRRTPVVMVEMSPQPGIGRFYSGILQSVGVPFRNTARADVLELLTLEFLPKIGTRMIIIDEIQNLLACNAVQQRQVLNLLKFLGNQLRIPLVGVGTEDAWSAIKTDPQLANRFHPHPLPVWSEGDSLLQLLMSLCQTLPLRRPSTIATEQTARQILNRTDGTIGEITRLLEALAVEAIRNGHERVTAELLAVSTYQSPNERRLLAESAVA